MKSYKEILIESKIKWSDSKLIKVLSKGLEQDEIFTKIALSLRKYNSTDPTGYVYSKKFKNLIDELWDRIGQPIQDSEQFSDDFIQQFKKNFYSLDKTLFNNLIFKKAK